MATIPIYRQQTAPGGVPNLGRVSPGAAAQVGQAVAQFGAQEARRIEQQMEEFDTLRAEEAFNRLRERQMSLMLDPERGFLARKGANAIAPDVVPTYTKDFTDAVAEIEGSLQSPRQKEAFKRRAAMADAEFKNALMRHVLDQSNRYADEVFQGTLQVEANRATTEWNNPYTVQLSLERIDAAVARQAQRMGLAPDAADALLRDARSKVHTNVALAAVEQGNIGYAEQYLKKNAQQMNATDLLKVQGLVQKEADQRFALGAATEVVQAFQRQAEPMDFDRLMNLVVQRESGGRQDAVSPKGAVGVAQVMPTTGPEAAKLAGLPWDEKRFRTDAEYNRRLGAAYLAKQLQTFGGDVSKALAAYNAGPGAVGNAIARAESEGKPDQWLTYLPKETRDYVAAITPQFAAGAGAAARPTLEEIHNAVRARVGTDNPDRLKLALDEATRQWEQREKARKQREDEALGEAFRALEANGGRWDALPASLKSRVPPDRLGSLREFASKVAKGEPIETDWDVYYTLRTNAALLQQTNLLALKSRLNDTEFKELSRLQQEFASGQGPDLQTRLQTPQQILSMRLAEMGVDPTPRPGSGDAKKVAQVWALLDRDVRAAEAALGRKLKPEEVVQQVDRLFTTVEVKGRLWGTNERRAFELQPGDQIVVPDEDRRQIMDALKATGQPVTEERITYYYKKAKGLR